LTAVVTRLIAVPCPAFDCRTAGSVDGFRPDLCNRDSIGHSLENRTIGRNMSRERTPAWTSTSSTARESTRGQRFCSRPVKAERNQLQHEHMIVDWKSSETWSLAQNAESSNRPHGRSVRQRPGFRKAIRRQTGAPGFTSILVAIAASIVVAGAVPGD